jgi:glutamate-1-semialdehyde 2,1-aminomutase
MSSSRFPGKVLKKIKGKSLVETIWSRLSKSTSIDGLVIAISDSFEDNPLHFEIESFGGVSFRGSISDVQERYIGAAQAFGADLVVRVTGDCPLVDWEIVDSVINLAIDSGADYASNTIPPTFPDGLDVEVFKLDALVRSRNEIGSLEASEHVTTDLRVSNLFTRENFSSPTDLSSLRWTVDYKDDLDQLESLLPAQFSTMTSTEMLDSGFIGIKSSAVRNEGSLMGSGQKLWSTAKDIIPGGSMLLSKRAEMYLPDQWPAYFSKSKGVSVWDLDGKEYLDFLNMSVGTCSLGYGVESIDLAVKKAIDDGVMSTLNSPAEVWLAQKLIEMHPWADMARFARSGGEANAIAVRIARASKKKDKIAICGYHGWHDWYLSANLSANSNLDGHLLPGLNPAGVPRGLLGTTVPFEYNDTQQLEKMLSTGEFAAVQMEVSRNIGPADGFLAEVRDLCDKYNAVLIFDECTSGFRETFGGLHLKYGVLPDLAMFGKAMGNGYAITAVIGRGEIMQAAEETFISSTFWTERLGPVAALATLSEMERIKSWEILPALGKRIKSFWATVFSKHEIEFKITGLDAIASFELLVPNWNSVKTLITQEMLDRGFLASASFYASTAHTDQEVDRYSINFDEVLGNVKDAIRNDQVGSLLRSGPAQTGFSRLN